MLLNKATKQPLLFFFYKYGFGIKKSIEVDMLLTQPTNQPTAIVLLQKLLDIK